jgi:tRNA-binding EMAP/Myf-like protein
MCHAGLDGSFCASCPRPISRHMAPKKPVESVAAAAEWVCAECECENDATDALCAACDAPRPAAAPQGDGGDERYAGYKVALVTAVEEVAGKKLRVVTLDTGVAGQHLRVVTAATNVVQGSRVVVATVGALVPDGAGETVAVKKASVGGVPSEGMLCDGPMLGWTGGGAGAAALLPESFPVGSTPPDKRPRMDGK